MLLQTYLQSQTLPGYSHPAASGPVTFGPQQVCIILQAGARYAEGLLKALGVQQAILVGHSAGALTAMELFKRYVYWHCL